MRIISKGRCHYEMVLIYQPPNAHVRISGILLRNAMAVAAVKNIYSHHPDDLPFITGEGHGQATVLHTDVTM
jgi:hypothetical protein